MKRSGYCEYCDKLVDIENAVLTKTDSYIEYYSGSCPSCKHIIYDLPTDDSETSESSVEKAVQGNEL